MPRKDYKKRTGFTWGRNIKLSDEAIQFLHLAHEGFRDGDWTFLAQSPVDSQAFHRIPVRISKQDERYKAIDLGDRCNIYTTANAFYTSEKYEHNYLFSLNALVADIDCHSKSIRPEVRDIQIDNLVHALRHAASDYSLLEPSYIVYTGRGIQIWWRHDSLSTKSCLWTWESVARRLQICLETILRDLGKDPVDGCPNLSLDTQASFNPTGLYRLPGTVNQAVKQTVTFEVLNQHLYTLAELKAFRDSIPLPRRYTAKVKDPVAWATTMAGKVIQLRNARQAPIGEELRNNFCFTLFCLYQTMGHDDDKAFDLVEQFNQGFRVPLRPNELKNTLRTAYRKTYRLGTQSIVRLLQITKAEQQAFSIFSCGKKAALQARAKANRAKRERTYNKVIELHKTGKYNYGQIAEKTHITTRTICKIIKNAGLCDYNTKQRDQKIIQGYLQGLERERIAELSGCGVRTVYRVIAQYRKTEEAAILAASSASAAVSSADPATPAFSFANVCRGANKQPMMCDLGEGGAQGAPPASTPSPLPSPSGHGSAASAGGCPGPSGSAGLVSPPAVPCPLMPTGGFGATPAPSPCGRPDPLAVRWVVSPFVSRTPAGDSLGRVPLRFPDGFFARCDWGRHQRYLAKAQRVFVRCLAGSTKPQ